MIYGGNYLEFDIILFYVLFCNVLFILLYVIKWGKNFNLIDRSVLVNIERICIKRNYYLYIKYFLILKIDFE